MTSSLRILDDICGPTRCSLDWDTFKGDERVRHCDSCRHTVLNLSALTQPEAERAFADPNVGCIRLVREADGTPVFAAESGCCEPDRPTTKPTCGATGFPRRRLRSFFALLWTGLVMALGGKFAAPSEAAPTPRVKVDVKKLERDGIAAKQKQLQPPIMPRKVYMGKF